METMLIAAFLLTRLKKYHPSFAINLLTIHRLLLASIVVSTKFFDDHYYNNAKYAKVCNMRTPDLNDIEVEFLYLVNFDLYVSSQEYQTVFSFFANREFADQK